jgi:hypothetical protein
VVSVTNPYGRIVGFKERVCTAGCVRLVLKGTQWRGQVTQNVEEFSNNREWRLFEGDSAPWKSVI